MHGVSTLLGIVFVNRTREKVALCALLCILSAAASAQDVLRVGTSGDYAPFSSRDSAGAWAGFDIVVAQRLAADLGRPVEFVPFRWPDLAAQMRADAFDIAMSGVTVRADRAVSFAFSRPYAVTGAVAVVRQRDRRRFQRVTDLDRQAVRIAVNRGGHLEQVARERFTHAQVTTVSDNSMLTDVLRRGEADAVISEALEARTWPAAEFVTFGPFTHDRKAYMLRREASELLHRVNDWLAAHEADGWPRRAGGDDVSEPQPGRALTSNPLDKLEQSIVTDHQATLDALVAAMDLRLQLMPLVAAVKRREQMPIEDPAQEARVLEHARAAAKAADLNGDDVAALFRVQIDAAKAVEHATTVSAPADASLADVRAAVTAASDQIITELARSARWFREPGSRAQIDAAVRNGLTTPKLSPALKARLVDGFSRVRPL